MQSEPRRISVRLLADEEFIGACAARDFSRIFDLARRSGIYPSRIARQCDLTTGRVGDVIAGRRGISQIDVVERIADGLGIPGRMLGLADRAWEERDRRVMPDADVAVTMAGHSTGPPPVTIDVGALLDGSVHGLWEGDEAVQRRQFLEASAAVVGWAAASIPPVPASGRLDGGTIDRLVRRSARLRQLDNYLGGAQTFPLYAAEVRASARLLKQGTYGDAVGRSLLALLAEQAQQAGWAAFDAGIHDQARHLYMESLKAAQQADDAALTGNAYAFLAYQQTALGQNGVEFAEASRDATQHRRVPATVRTLLHERTAWAYATAGDPTNAERALAHAEETIRDVSAEPGPDWAAWVDHAEVQIMTGRVWAVLNKPLRAVPVLKQVLTGFDDAQARDKALYLSWLADSYIDAGEIEQAATITRRCAELSSDIASVRPKLRTAALCKRLEPYRSLPAIAEVLEQTGGTGRPRSGAEGL